MIKGLKFGFWTGFLALLMLSASAAARAATPPRSASVALEEKSPPILYLTAAVNQGSSALSNAVPGATGDSGSRTELLLLATLELGSFVIEGGGGWMRDRLSGTATPPANATGFSPTAYDLVTYAGIAELSPRYRVVGGFEIGPLAELIYGPDVTFAPGFSGGGAGTAWLGGGQALYALKLPGTVIRAGARYLQSLNLQDRTLTSVQATLQFGLPLL